MIHFEPEPWKDNTKPLRQLIEAGAGGEVHLPNQGITFNEPIVIPNRTTLIGQGSESSVLNAKGNAGLVIQGTDTVRLVSFGLNRSIDDAAPSIAGIHVETGETTSKLILDRLHIAGFATGLFLADAIHTSIIDCQIANCGRAIKVHGVVNDLSVVRTRFISNETAISGGSIGMHSWSFRDGSFELNGPCLFNKIRGLTFEANHVEANQCDVFLVLQDCDGVSIRGNSFSSNRNGEKVTGWYGSFDSCLDESVEANAFEPSKFGSFKWLHGEVQS